MADDIAPVQVAESVQIEGGHTETAVWIQGEAGRLAGILTESSGSGPIEQPVLLVHGWSTYRIGPHGLLVKLARGIAQSGGAALRFDFRGRGESDGEYDQTDLDGMIADAQTCAEWLSARSGGRTVAAVGMCAGGNVAAGAAALGGKIGPLVSVGMLPYQSEKSGGERVARASRNMKGLVGKLLSAESWKKLISGRIRWGRIFTNVSGREVAAPPGAAGPRRNMRDSNQNIPASFAKYEGKILFVFGGADPEGAAAHEHFLAFADKTGLDAYFHTIDGANHNFYSRVWTELLIERCLDFLAIEGEHSVA